MCSEKRELDLNLVSQILHVKFCCDSLVSASSSDFSDESVEFPSSTDDDEMELGERWEDEEDDGLLAISRDSSSLDVVEGSRATLLLFPICNGWR